MAREIGPAVLAKEDAPDFYKFAKSKKITPEDFNSGNAPGIGTLLYMFNEERRNAQADAAIAMSQSTEAQGEVEINIADPEEAVALGEDPLDSQVDRSLLVGHEVVHFAESNSQ